MYYILRVSVTRDMRSCCCLSREMMDCVSKFYVRNYNVLFNVMSIIATDVSRFGG